MFKEYKIKKIIFFSVIILIFNFCFFIISAPGFANDKNVDKITKEKIDSDVNCSIEYLKLLEAMNIKVDVANEKEAAYDKAINGLKLYVFIFGTLLLIIAVIFGFYRDNKIVNTKKEIMDDIENKKKSLEEGNANNVEKKMLELEKFRNEKIKEIQDNIESNIKDVQKRLSVLEGSGKDINEKNKNEDEDVKNRIKSSENEEYKNENPYD